MLKKKLVNFTARILKYKHIKKLKEQQMLKKGVKPKSRTFLRYSIFTLFLIGLSEGVYYFRKFI